MTEGADAVGSVLRGPVFWFGLAMRFLLIFEQTLPRFFRNSIAWRARPASEADSPHEARKADAQ